MEVEDTVGWGERSAAADYMFDIRSADRHLAGEVISRSTGLRLKTKLK